MMNITNQETGETTNLELQSEDIAELIKALAKAQGAMAPAKVTGQNPHFRSSYATLDDIWQAARKPLTDNGLCIVQSLMPDNTLVTTLAHSSGQWMRSYLRLNPVKNDPQGIGSALTYGRRYSLAAMVGVAQSDDDGEAASQPTPAQPVSQPKVTNGNTAKTPDPMTRYWAEIKAAGLTREKGLEILAGANNDPSRAVDVVLGIVQV